MKNIGDVCGFSTHKCTDIPTTRSTYQLSSYRKSQVTNMDLEITVPLTSQNTSNVFINKIVHLWFFSLDSYVYILSFLEMYIKNSVYYKLTKATHALTMGSSFISQTQGPSKNCLVREFWHAMFSLPLCAAFFWALINPVDS